MKFIRTFTELVAEVDDDDRRLNQDGVNELFEIFEWLCSGRTLDTYPKTNIVTAQVLMALAWVDARDATLAREELDSE